MYWVIIFALAGASPLPYSIGVMLLFAGVAYFIYRIGDLFGGRTAGLVSGILVALYFPIYSVAWSRWSSSLQMELFFLSAAMFFLLRWSKAELECGQRAKAPVLGIVLLVCAFLSKETSLLAPLLLPLYAWKRRVIGMAAALFGAGVVLFITARALIPCKFPLPGPSLDVAQAFSNLEFYLRHQFLFYLPPSLVLLGALSRGHRNRYVWLTLGMVLFLVMNLAIGYTDTTHRVKLAVSMAAIVYAFVKGQSGMRFSLGWAALLLMPPLSMHDTTIHQTSESFLGFSLFLGIGVARQLRLFGRMFRRLILNGPPRFPVGNLFAARRTGTVSEELGLAVRSVGASASVLIAAYAVFSIISLNVRLGSDEAHRMAVSYTHLRAHET